MYVINPEDLSIHDFPDTNKEPFKTGHIFCIRPDNSGNLWVGTSDGLFCFNGGKMIYHFTSSQSKLPPGNVYEIFLIHQTMDGYVLKRNMPLGGFYQEYYYRFFSKRICQS